MKLATLTGGKGDHRMTESERSKCIADLTECLRTYDILGLWRDAEDVIRRDIMRSFVKKVAPFLSPCMDILFSNV